MTYPVLIKEQYKLSKNRSKKYNLCEKKYYNKLLKKAIRQGNKMDIKYLTSDKKECINALNNSF